MSNPSSTAADPQRTMMVFTAGENDYALAIEEVSEVLRMVAIDRIPGSPEWQAGAINLRGQVIPVIDLRVRLGFSGSVGIDTPIVIAGRDADRIGVIVDNVNELLDFDDSQIETASHLGNSSELVSRVIRDGRRLILRVDLECLAADVKAA